MTVTVLLFAQAKDLAGLSRVELEFTDGMTVADVRGALQSRFPGLAEILPWCQFAVDQQYAANDHALNGRSEIGCIPPVSGG